MKMKLTLVLLFAATCRLSAQIEVISSGNVGVGTTNPDNKLTLAGATSSTIGISFGKADAGITASRYIGITRSDVPTDLGANSGFSGIEFGGPGSSAEGILAFHTHDYGVASGERMRINKSGNVGIGTSNPSNNLTILQKTDTQGSDGVRVYRANGTSSGVFFQGGDDNTYLFNYGGGFAFYVNGSVSAMNISNTGNLSVVGTVRAVSFISNTTTYADFVFKPGYQLASLSEVEQHINEHGTLPGVPSEAQVAKDGIDLGAMQVKLLQKVEELTLHAIAQQKEIAVLRQELADLKNR